ncbi:hypothetical protein [Nocardiopsis alkaliphila]|uniref:hypothetical protein n=1 Tax=Nocardiopsis alkaliphila TaxID=225762 RepID=UPI001EFA061C|nr:hypothetical protein [Nocardiopsis alkaliphila]
MDVRGDLVTAVYRPVEAQRALRADGRTLGPRLGAYQVLQALPLGEWVPVEGLTDREQRILPAIPTWTRKRRNGRLFRLADLPVRLDLLVTQGTEWLDALDRACVLGLAAPRMAVCFGPVDDGERAVWEADYRGVGLATYREGEMRILVHPQRTVPESAASLHWRLAEQVFSASQGALSERGSPKTVVPVEV